MLPDWWIIFVTNNTMFKLGFLGNVYKEGEAAVEGWNQQSKMNNFNKLIRALCLDY